MAIIKATDASFNKDVLKSDKVVLVDFWAPWCAPCRMIAPILEELNAELDGKLTVVKLNVDENPGMASIYQIMSIPTLKLFKDGKVVESIIGLQPKQAMRSLIDQYL